MRDSLVDLAPVAQLDRALDYESRGQEFESSRAHHHFTSNIHYRESAFICRGWKELIHELMHPDWLAHIKIIQPQELKDEFKNYLKKCESVVS